MSHKSLFLYVFLNVPQMLQAVSSSSSLASLSTYFSWSVVTSTKSLQHFLDDFSFFACHVLASTCNLSKTFGVVKTSNSFGWARLCFFLAISPTFLVFWEDWAAMPSTIACYRCFRGDRDQERLPVFSSAKSLTSVTQSFILTTFLLSGQSPDHLKRFTRWEVVLLSQRIFMSVGNNPFLNACIRVSRLKQ